MSVDLRIRYLGLELRNPLVAAASPLTARLDSLRALEQAGAGAVVLGSLFEEQIEQEELEHIRAVEAGTESYGEALSYFPLLDGYTTVPQAYVAHLQAAKEALSIPVIASLNGTTSGGWTRYARLLEQAGADALELNVYAVEADADIDGVAVEERILELVRSVRAAVAIPLAVKIGPFFSSTANVARRLEQAGADGLVLFNRFVQPDIDLETLAVVPRVTHLSNSAELLLPLRWIAILHGRVGLSLAGSGGVHTAEDALKLLLAGASAVMTTSALLERGPEYLAVLLSCIRDWLDEHEYESVSELVGSISQRSSPDPAAFERASYVRALSSYRIAGG